MDLMCEALEGSGRKGYKVTWRGSYLRLLPSQLATPCVVSPTGLEGFCKSLSASWGIPFKGSVNAA
jgi:hypothetical protein